MQSVAVFSLCIILLTSVVSSSYHPVTFKRQLYAFPRVGRAMSLGDPYHYVKRQSFEPHSFDTVGMFFGPRLVRTYPADDVDIPENETEGGEPEQFEPHSDRKKRNTKAT